MSTVNVLNMIGLVLGAIGGIGAAFCVPGPSYNADGSVSLSGIPEKERRVAVHRRQKWLGPLLSLVGVGALLQALVILAAP